MGRRSIPAAAVLPKFLAWQFRDGNPSRGGCPVMIINLDGHSVKDLRLWLFGSIAFWAVVAISVWILV
jgi:hypothetical protein